MSAPPALLRALPPVYLFAAGLDPLLDDAIMFARHARDAGCRVHLDVFKEVRVSGNACIRCADCVCMVTVYVCVCLCFVCHLTRERMRSMLCVTTRVRKRDHVVCYKSCGSTCVCVNACTSDSVRVCGGRTIETNGLCQCVSGRIQP